MKKLVLGILLLCGSLSFAAEITGLVFVDINGNAVFDTGDRPLEGVLVTDGANFVRTGADGVYRIETAAHSEHISVHQPSGFVADKFWKKIDTTAAGDFNFVMKPRRVRDFVSFLQVADQETTKFGEWLANFKELAENCDVDFLFCSGDLCRFPSIRQHSELVNAATMGREVYYSVGNHDIVKADDNGKNYGDYLGPFWYSFERNGVLFIVSPMTYGEVPLPYKLENYGDWLAKLLTIFPVNQPKVMLGHYPLNIGRQMLIKTSTGEIDPEQYNLKAFFYGHNHINRVRRYENSDLASYCVSTPNHGGISHDPNSIRYTELYRGKVHHSKVIWSMLREHLHMDTYAGNLLVSPNGSLRLSGVVFNSYDPFIKTDAIIIANGESLYPYLISFRGDWSYYMDFMIPESFMGQEVEVEFTIVQFSGKIFKTTRRATIAAAPAVRAGSGEWHNQLGSAGHNGFFPDHAGGALKQEWVFAASNSALRTSPVVSGSRVFYADFEDNTRGGGAVYAVDIADGRCDWVYALDYAAKGPLAFGGNMVFVSDSENTIYALDANSGKLVWRNNGNWQYMPDFGGVTYADGVVYGGAGPGFRALKPATGEVIWRNEAWKGSQAFNGAPMVGGDVVVTASNWGGVFAHRRSNGELLWKRTTDDDRYIACSQVFANGRVWFKNYKQLHEIDPLTGELFRSIVIGTDAQSPAPPVVTDSVVIVPTSVAGIKVFDLKDNTLKWSFVGGEGMLDVIPYRHGGSTVTGGVLVLGDYVYMPCNDGYLYVLDLKSGKELEKHFLGSPVMGSPAVIGDRLFVTDFAGRLFGFRFVGER